MYRSSTEKNPNDNVKNVSQSSASVILANQFQTEKKIKGPKRNVCIYPARQPKVGSKYKSEYQPLEDTEYQPLYQEQPLDSLPITNSNGIYVHILYANKTLRYSCKFKYKVPVQATIYNKLDVLIPLILDH